MSADYLSSLGGGDARGIARYGRSVSIPRRVGAAYQSGRTPATVAARVGAQLIDWFLLLPLWLSAILLLAAFTASPVGFGGPLPPLAAFAAVLSVHWLHSLALEGGAAAATLGKRLVGLQVVTGSAGVPLGAGPAFVRRALSDVWFFGGIWCAVRLTSLRQYGGFFEADPFTGIDWGILVVFVLVFYVPWVAYRASAFACQWPHDRICNAVVVWRVKQPVVIEARPVAPLPPAAPLAGTAAAKAVAAPVSETTAMFAAAQLQADNIGAPPVAQPGDQAVQSPERRARRRKGPPPAQPRSLAATAPPGEGEESAAAPARKPAPQPDDAVDELPAALPAAKPGGDADAGGEVDVNADAEAEEEAVDPS